MKKNLSYRDKLIELAQIYNVKEIKDYLKEEKIFNFWSIRTYFKKNKIAIPKDFKSNFLKNNFIKPVGKVSKLILLSIKTV